MDTVEVIDPAHPLYGRTFALDRLTKAHHIGSACVVWIDTDIKRIIPLAATNLSSLPPDPPSVCRLSLSSATQLVAVLASVADVQSPDAREAHADTETGASAAPPTADPAAGDIPRRSGNISERHFEDSDEGGRSVSDLQAEQGMEDPSRGGPETNREQLDEDDAGGRR